MPPNYLALTGTSKAGILRALGSEAEVCAVFDPALPVDQRAAFEKFIALWDTGATASVITQKVVDKCGLKPTGMVQVSHAHGTALAETFLVNLRHPNGVGFAGLAVTRGQLTGTDVLIGMDIITTGDFSITNAGGRTVFSFRVPSQGTVDFVQEHGRQVAAEAAAHRGKGPPTGMTPKQFGMRRKPGK